jgi:peptidoglycan/LPS O-acetylase OafA/YrhL
MTTSTGITAVAGPAAAAEIPQLTGLRAIAALMVLVLHLDQICGNRLAAVFSPVAQGFLGVDLFFVLSGYILTHVYAADAATSVRHYGIFLWRRLARIYPLHLATLAFLFAMVAARGLLNTNFWSIAELPRHLLLLQAWTPDLSWNLPSWSISAEWAAYVCFPLFILLIVRPANIVLPLLVVAVTTVAFYLFGISKVGIGASLSGVPAAARIACEFSLGVLGYRIASGLPASPWADAVAVAAFVAIFWVPPGVLQVIAIAIVVPAIALSTGWVRQLLASRFAVGLGVVSYSVYMVHFPAIKVIQNINEKLGWDQLPAASSAAVVALWSVVVIAIAVAAYFGVEKPARAWCRRREAGLFRLQTA